MNSIVAASLFDNPWVILVIVFVGAIFNWFMKRRQAGGLAPPNENASPPALGQQRRPTRQPELQDILRQLLGGEPPPALTPPVIPQAAHKEQPSSAEGDEEPFRAERMWPDESQEPDEGLRQSPNQVAERSRRHTVEASAFPTRLEADDRHENAVRRVGPFDGESRHPGRRMRSAHRPFSSAGGRAVRLWRDRQTVRRAFVASLIFAPPKGLEA